jgi:predicted DNA-binding protein (MmcQ/YjbR family)
MYADDDPRLGDVRKVCLSLPEAVEVETWGRPSFRAGARGKIFALYGSGEDHPAGLLVKPEPGERAALEADERFFVPRYWGPSGWLGLDLATDPDWTEVRELVVGSFRLVALKRQLAALEED